MFNINQLNEKQKAAAVDTEGAILVTAGAGSGKTRLLTYRVCYLVEALKVDPHNILAITFTNKATNEMKERITEMLPNAYNVWISTFHSMCVRILRDNIGYIDGYNRFFTVYDSNDRDKIIKGLIKDIPNNTDLKNKISYHIANAKNNGYGPREYKRVWSGLKDIDDICEYYARYETQLKNNNAFDFDDLLFKTLILFESNSEVLSKYQNRFKYILVDEFQDTNLVQYKLIKHLSDVYKNIFAVGDEDQCIYGWRGANIENIINFKKDFPNCKHYMLEQNYRSTKNILNAANKLIKNNLSRTEKNLWTENFSGEAITFKSCYDENEEAEYVVTAIDRLLKSGIMPNQIAVLMRVSALSRLFEEKLLNYNIPFKVSGIFKFFERAEIKNVLAYLRLVINSKDSESLIRIINFPKRGIGQASIDKLIEIGKENNCSLTEIILNYSKYNFSSAVKSKIEPFATALKEVFSSYENLQLDEFVKYVIDRMNIKSAYNNNTEEDEDRLLNISGLIDSVKTFCNNNPSFGLNEYLESVTLQSSIDEAETGNAVCVSTVHASKGLEFEVVFIVGAEESKFPLERCFDNVEEMEEERRLMYVAITRAKQKLFITKSNSRFLYGRREGCMDSRFLKEMGIVNEVKIDYTPYSERQYYSKNSNDIFSKNNYKKDYNNSGFGAMQYTTQNADLSSFLGDKIEKQKKDYTSYTPGTLVLHPKFGVGTIEKIETCGDNATVCVKFTGFGIKTLSLNLAPLQIIKKA